MKRTISLLILALAVCGTVTKAATPTPPPLVPYILRWAANPANQNIVFYNVYTKTLAGTYIYTATVTPIIPPPINIDWTIPVGTPGGTTFAVTASNGRVESDRSNDATVPSITSPGGTQIVSVETGGLRNISTRAKVGKDDDVMIAGFILDGTEKVVLRAIGPSLAQYGLDALDKATIELHDNDGAVIASNDGWKTGPDKDELIRLGLAPQSDQESALVATLDSNAYTAIVRGGTKDGTGLVEVYGLP